MIIMTKKLPILAIIACFFFIYAGCSKTKNQLETPVAATTGVEGQEGSQPNQNQSEREPRQPSELGESEIDQKMASKTYPGIEGEFMETSILKDVHFAYDQSDLSKEACKILSENAEWLKKYPEAKIQIEGHCDERGSTGYNLALGERRSAGVRDYLTSLEIAPDRLSTISYGEEMPLDSGHSEEAWAKNRRAHMIIIGNTPPLSGNAPQKSDAQ